MQFFGGRGFHARASRGGRGRGGAAGGASPAAEEDVDVSEIYEVVAIGLPEAVFKHARDIGWIDWEDPYPPHKETAASNYIAVKPLDEKAEQPTKLSEFIRVSAATRIGDDEDPSDVLAKTFGIYCRAEIALAESNSPQQIGDMSVAMSALRERADEAAAEGGADEPEP